MNARTALLPALVVLLLAGCAAGEEQEGTTASAAPASTAPAAAPSTTQTQAPAPTTAPTPTVRTVAVAYAGGEVTGTSGREEVPLGEQVVLRVSSDVAEEVHVHGYDLQGAVPAGGSVDIPVTASIPGVFEVELHDAGRVLFQLRVT